MSMDIAGAPLLEVADVAHSFGGLTVLRRVSFSVSQGGIVGLIGPNGSGKSTLFNIISGFMKQKAGSVRYGGVDISSDSVVERSRLGLVRTFQTPKVFERMSVLENVMAGYHKSTHTGVVQNLLMTPAARREIRLVRDRAEAVCEKFGLTPVCRTPAGLLPAGQRRNLELARAFAGNPKLLLLDEPSAGLNTEEIEHLSKWLLMLKQEGLTILLVSHDMDLMGVAGVVNVLYFGEIIASGAMEFIQQDQAVRDAYLGV